MKIDKTSRWCNECLNKSGGNAKQNRIAIIIGKERSDTSIHYNTFTLCDDCLEELYEKIGNHLQKKKEREY